MLSKRVYSEAYLMNTKVETIILLKKGCWSFCIFSSNNYSQYFLFLSLFVFGFVFKVLALNVFQYYFPAARRLSVDISVGEGIRTSRTSEQQLLFKPR